MFYKIVQYTKSRNEKLCIIVDIRYNISKNIYPSMRLLAFARFVGKNIEQGLLLGF